MATRVLVAFDKFKDALTAERAGAIAAHELGRLHPDWIVECVAITDGGDGFGRILTQALDGETVMVSANDARLERRDVPIGLIDGARLPAGVKSILTGAGFGAMARGKVAVVEMAAINGLAQVPREARDPWAVTSYGSGQLIRAAAELGVEGIVLGVGGSATSDLGLGALSALGFEFSDAAAAKICPPFPSTWERITRIEGERFASLPPIAIACDVSHPLLGAGGAAAVFGPQKGLRPEDLARHESQAARLAELLCIHCGRDVAAMVATPGSGAAGGVAFGLMAAAGAQLVPGFALVSAWLELDSKLAAADIVVTGEGRFDASSLAGKGPGEIVQRARALGRRVVVLAGAVGDGVASAADVEVIGITPRGVDLATALSQTDRNLAAAVVRCFS